ncbi:hypothetical protein [Falsiroseomonas sp. CW058]|uniref:hypothetical protein n=1 Tax=Falsiroseomonas sp. CW058 TaxID=3388664 RepID=UPI003D317CD3
MTAAPALLALLVTLVLGVVVGVGHLGRRRSRGLVRAHLVAALAATGLVALLLLAGPPPRPGAPPGWVVLALPAAALAAGWGALRHVRSPRGAEAVLAAHALAGVAGFLVFLAWIRTG